MKGFIKKLGLAIFSIILFVFLLLASLWVWGLFVDELPNEDINFGITFSNIYAEELGLDWKETYIAVLDDLGVKRIRISAYWSEIESEKDVLNYNSLDFQVEEAKKRDVEIILAVGQKLPRWPECHISDWARESENKDEELLEYIEETVNRYKDIEQIKYWQVENEPFLAGFGSCPPPDKDLLDREIALVKTLDSRPILITDSGELGDWVRARKRGDIFGTTMYRDVWFKRTIRFRYPLSPTWFEFKEILTRKIGGIDSSQKIIVVEMQAEAWGRDPIPYLTLEQQLKYMDFDNFKENISYSKRARFPDIYLWGVEWWYYLKTTQEHPEFWSYARELF